MNCQAIFRSQAAKTIAPIFFALLLFLFGAWIGKEFGEAQMLRLSITENKLFTGLIGEDKCNDAAMAALGAISKDYESLATNRSGFLFLPQDRRTRINGKVVGDVNQTKAEILNDLFDRFGVTAPWHSEKELEEVIREFNL